MGWREAVGEGFGPQRDDEPGQLRRDIIDELCDHLHCALRRELLRTADEAAAERAVLERFGSPPTIARRLWLDAMKEKIMSQRIMLVAVVLLAGMCVAMSAFVWVSFNQGRQLNQAILASLEAMMSRDEQSDLPLDWARISVRVVAETEDGEPVGGRDVDLHGKAFNSADDQTLRGRTDDQGTVAFGPIRPGTYRLSVNAFTGLPSAQVTLYPGRASEQLVVLASTTRAMVTYQIDWPEDLEQQELLICCKFYRPRAVSFGGERWRGRSDSLVLTPANERLLGGYRLHGPSLRRQDRSILFCNLQDVTATRQVEGVTGDQMLSGITVFSRTDRSDGVGVAVWEECAKYEYPHDARPVFEVRSGAVNDWRIEAPEKLWEQVRESLAAGEQETEGEVGVGPGFGKGTSTRPR